MPVLTQSDELKLLSDADERAAAYIAGIGERRAFPSAEALAALTRFDEAISQEGRPEAETLRLLDEAGSPATVASNGPRYFGFVVGACLPVASAAERLMLAWDQTAGLYDSSPVAAKVEAIAAKWALEILGLPDTSAVGFGTSASACALTCLAAARRSLLARAGWDPDKLGLAGAPRIRVILPQTIHVTIRKALRVLGYGTDDIIFVPVDTEGRIDPLRLPKLDEMSILCLQAGEVNTGEFDRFAEIIPTAKAAGTWVHIDGAFGLWANASPDTKHLTAGIADADSWTVDGHKWLNTPYECAMAICREPTALAAAMNSDAIYASASKDSQKNLTLEFSRRPRGIPVWAALRSLGRSGVAELIERHRRQARDVADGLRTAGYEVLNRVVLNQVLFRAATDEETLAVGQRARATGQVWFGGSIWQGRPALRISVCSWRTTDADINGLVELLGDLKKVGP